MERRVDGKTPTDSSSQGRYMGVSTVRVDMGRGRVFCTTDGTRLLTTASVPLPWCTSKSKMHTRFTV
jgi:hypothetical protein